MAKYSLTIKHDDPDVICQVAALVGILTCDDVYSYPVDAGWALSSLLEQEVAGAYNGAIDPDDAQKHAHYLRRAADNIEMHLKEKTKAKVHA